MTEREETKTRYFAPKSLMELPTDQEILKEKFPGKIFCIDEWKYGLTIQKKTLIFYRLNQLTIRIYCKNV